MRHRLGQLRADQFEHLGRPLPRGQVVGHLLQIRLPVRGRHRGGLRVPGELGTPRRQEPRDDQPLDQVDPYKRGGPARHVLRIASDTPVVTVASTRAIFAPCRIRAAHRSTPRNHLGEVMPCRIRPAAASSAGTVSRAGARSGLGRARSRPPSGAGMARPAGQSAARGTRTVAWCADPRFDGPTRPTTAGCTDIRPCGGAAMLCSPASASLCRARLRRMCTST